MRLCRLDWRKLIVQYIEMYACMTAAGQVSHSRPIFNTSEPAGNGRSYCVSARWSSHDGHSAQLKMTAEMRHS